MDEFVILDEKDTYFVKTDISHFMMLDLENFTEFCSLLQETGSVIAGGIILNSLEEFENNHDSYVAYIYTTFNGARKINDFLKDKETILNNEQFISVVSCDNLFLRPTKVKVKLVYNLANFGKKIKLMVVKDRKDILNAVRAFDLSFTRVLFDGVNVKATHPEDIKTKSGHLDEDYTDLLLNFNPDIIDRIVKYRDRGFSITINTPTATTIVKKDKISKSPTGINEEEFVVNYLYKNLISRMITSSMSEHFENFGRVDMYLKYFQLIDSVDEFFELLKKLSMKKCILPFWIKNEYETKFSSDIVKAMALQECGLITLVLEDSEGSYLQYALRVLKQKFPLEKEIIEYKKNTGLPTYEYNDLLIWIAENYENIISFSGNQLIKNAKNDIYWNEKNLCILKDEEERFQIQESLSRKTKRNRNIEWLNIVEPIPTTPVPLDSTDTKCMDFHEEGYYDINGYLRGEAVKGYNEEGELDDTLDLPAVSADEARERLVFFVKAKSDSNEFKPFCYNLRGLAKDVSHQMFLECEGENSMKNIMDHLDYPILKLNLGWPVYVPLGELLHAIYNTNKQDFILFPQLDVVVEGGELVKKEKEFKYTASLSTLYGNDYVSSTHCGFGTDKPIYTIRECEGKEDNVCWPVTDELVITEYKPDTYFLTQRYYILDKEIDRLTRENFVLGAKMANLEMKLELEKLEPKPYISSNEHFEITILSNLEMLATGVKILRSRATVSYIGDDPTFIDHIESLNIDIDSLVSVKMKFFSVPNITYKYTYDWNSEPNKYVEYSEGYKGLLGEFKNCLTEYGLDIETFRFLQQLEGVDYGMLMCCICQALQTEIITPDCKIISEEFDTVKGMQRSESIPITIKNYESFGFTQLFPEIYEYVMERVGDEGLLPMIATIKNIIDFCDFKRVSPELLAILPKDLCKDFCNSDLFE